MFLNSTSTLKSATVSYMPRNDGSQVIIKKELYQRNTFTIFILSMTLILLDANGMKEVQLFY